MESKIRKIIFFIFLLTFLIVAPISALYVQGYRFDFKNKKLTQTGGLFLKTTPKQTEIYLDGELSKKTDFFFSSALVENLLPKSYNIVVRKEGYFDWEKNLDIREKEVTEVKNIVLFPKNIEFTLLNKNIEDIWFSPDQKKLVWKEKEGENSWSLKLYDLDKNLKSHLLEKSDLPEKEGEIINLEFSPDVKEIYFDSAIKEEVKKFSLEIDRIPIILKEIKESVLPPFENIVTYQKSDGDTYYLDNTGCLYKTDADFLRKEKITETPVSLKPDADYKLYIFDDFIFLKEAKTLYLLNKEEKLFETFFEENKSLKVSPDWRKLVYFSNSEIQILYLKEESGQPRRIKGEKVFLVRLSEKINDVFWLTSDYLIFNTENCVKIAEIDNRDHVNIIDLAQFKNQEIFWSSSNKKVYILSQDGLWASDRLLP